MKKMTKERTCETCLFYVDAMPHIVICIAGKRVKEYLQTKTNCKKWIENTTKNAKEQLKLIKKEKE